MDDTLVLTRGKHATREDGMCLMEAVAREAGEQHTDTPHSVPQEVAFLGIRVNDAHIWHDDADRTATLVPLIPSILKAAHGDGPRQRRIDFAVSLAISLAVEVLKTRGLQTHEVYELLTCVAAYRKAINQQEHLNVGVDLGTNDPNARPTLTDIWLSLDDAANAYCKGDIVTLAGCAANVAATAAAALITDDDTDASRIVRRTALINLLMAFCEA